MAWWRKNKPSEVETPKQEMRKQNPFLSPNLRSNGGFFSADVGRLLQGWDTSSSSIDYYLRTELRELRARSRKMVRSNPYGKRFIATLKSNVIGPSGVSIQAQSMIYRRGEGDVLDTAANDAIEKAFKDWGQHHCDYLGKHNWVDMQNMAISCAGQDGEFIFQQETSGKYGYQLKCIDPELLDVLKNEHYGKNEIRLGVEYNKKGEVIAYWFREKEINQYDRGKSNRVMAEKIIHGFISEWPDQSRGIPWMHASLERSKHLEKYDEAAIVKARSTAATMAFLQSPPGDDAYEGDEQYGNDTIDQYEAGSIRDIGDRQVVNVDSAYPHQMYAQFVKSHLQGIASGLGISYHTLANDLEGVNYSSIRAGVLEDREIFKGLQNWFIRSFVQPVYERWLLNAWATKMISVGIKPLNRPIDEYMPAHYQGRRWAWVDPAKDGAFHKMAIDERLKSRSQIMREQGDDPESVWREIQRDQQMMEQLGIQTIESETPTEGEPDG